MLCSLLFYTKSCWYLGAFKKNARVADNCGPVSSAARRRSQTPSLALSACSCEWFWWGLEKGCGWLSEMYHSFHKSLCSTDRWVQSYFSINSAFYFHLSFSLLFFFFSFLVWKRVCRPSRNTGSIAEKGGKD